MTVDERLFISAKTARLEAILTRPTGMPAAVGVISSPYPPLGGDMNHKVVTKLAQAFLDENMAALKYNYRGTGRSEGAFKGSAGSREDLDAVLSWATKNFSGIPIRLAGYSFGAYISLSSLQRTVSPSFPGRYPIEGVIAVAFPAGNPEFPLPGLPEAPCCFIHGQDDELAPPAALTVFLGPGRAERNVRWIEGANHFFDGRLPALLEACRRCLKS